jgi:hypothetical protein
MRDRLRHVLKVKADINALSPECLDDYVTGDNPLRFTEASVDELAFSASAILQRCQFEPCSG